MNKTIKEMTNVVAKQILELNDYTKQIETIDECNEIIERIHDHITYEEGTRREAAYRKVKSENAKKDIPDQLAAIPNEFGQAWGWVTIKQ